MDSVQTKKDDIIIDEKYVVMRYNIEPLSCNQLTKIIFNLPVPVNEDICKVIWKYYFPKPDREQVVTIDEVYISENNIKTYAFSYGVYGFHEGFTKRENIRELTEKEKLSDSNRKFWELPQQFYQSFPS